MKISKLAIVLPFYNEEESLAELVAGIEASVTVPFELVFIDDGSSDSSLELVKSLELKDSNNSKRVVILSRNFGHQQALMAGLSEVCNECDAILTMDTDLQDLPTDIPTLLAKYLEGYDCVYAIRRPDSGSFIVDAFTKIFYRLQKKLLSFSVPEYAGTFSVFNRKILKTVLEFKESEVYFPGLRAFAGFKQTGVKVSRGKRKFGLSKVGIIGLLNLSMTGLIGFSNLPMRLVFLFGAILTVLCGIISVAFFIMRIVGITKIAGVTTVLIAIFGLVGIQIMSIGLLGEYIGKLFVEAKKRPRWVIAEVIDEK